MQFLVENGVAAGVMMAPLLPGMSDSYESIHAVAAAAAAHKAQFVGANVLFLKPGSKEWFMPLLRETHPHLTQAYATMYRKTYAPKEYTDRVMAIVDEARRHWRLGTKSPPRTMQGTQQQLQLALTA